VAYPLSLRQPLSSVDSQRPSTRTRIKEITDVRLHYGYRRVYVFLWRDGFVDIHMHRR